MFPKKPILTSLTLILCLASFGQKPRFKDKRVAARVKTHIEYLSSNDLEGRYTATSGEKKSAEYIAGQFEKIGLIPKGDIGYLQHIEVPNMRMAQPNSSLKLGNDVLTLFTDFYPINISSNNGRYTGEAIHMNYGIEDPGLNHLDYEGKNVKGKAVIINLDIPGGLNQHNRFMSWEDAEMRVEYAISRGARAILFYTTNNALKPSGKLEKTLENTGKPVLFINRDLSNITTEQIDLNLDIMLLSVQAHNIIGTIENESDYTVVITAHHDHLGIGNNRQTPPAFKNQIHRGADNNASGIAALLELAREITSKPKKYRTYNYMFVAFTGAELEQLGSRFFVESKPFGSIETNYVLNLDMVGHLDSTGKELFISGAERSATLESILSTTKIAKHKIIKVNTNGHDIGPSDLESFHTFDVPTVLVTTGKQSYSNTPEDNLSVINFGGEAYIIRYLTKTIRRLDQHPPLRITNTAKQALYTPAKRP